jgi:hypothetical protein
VKVGFQSETATVMTGDGRHCALVYPITYIALDGRVFVIPKGATFSGAHSPHEIWPFLPPFGLYWLASALHECARNNSLQVVNIQGTGQDQANLTKDECDLLYKEALESMKVDPGTVEKLFIGVTECDWLKFRVA